MLNQETPGGGRFPARSRKELPSFEVFPCWSQGRKENIVLGVGKLVLSIMLGFGRAEVIPGSHLDSWYDLGQSLQTRVFVKHVWLSGYLRGDLESQLSYRSEGYRNLNTSENPWKSLVSFLQH